MQMANVEGLLRKVGVEYVVIKAGAYKDVGNFSRAMTPEERRILQALLDDVYGQFVAAVAKGRGLDEGTVRSFADGRIYSGRQAHALKMVDELRRLRGSGGGRGQALRHPGQAQAHLPAAAVLVLRSAARTARSGRSRGAPADTPHPPDPPLPDVLAGGPGWG